MSKKNNSSNSNSEKKIGIDPNDIHDIWEFETGYILNGSVAFELESMANENFELTRQAIIAAVKANCKSKVSFNYFKAIFNSLKEETEKKIKKGGEEVGTAYQYAPATNAVKPWEQH